MIVLIFRESRDFTAVISGEADGSRMAVIDE